MILYLMEGLPGYLGDFTKVTCLVTFSLEAELGVGGVSSESEVVCMWGRGDWDRAWLMWPDGVRLGTATHLLPPES